jgi:hypothetical protein
MENFQFKARLVANGNETGPPANLTYASVVSRESVRIALTLAALNELEVKTSDIENAYLTAPTDERLYAILGNEFEAGINNVEEFLMKRFNRRNLSKKDTKAPFTNGYRPELDLSEELDSELITYYMSRVGVLRWMVELGSTDIITEVSELASQLALPQDGHLDAIFRMFSYLKYKKNSLMVFDPTYPVIDMENFPKRDWNNFYGNVKEQMPPTMPKPQGGEVILNPKAICRC